MAPSSKYTKLVSIKNSSPDMRESDDTSYDFRRVVALLELLGDQIRQFENNLTAQLAALELYAAAPAPTVVSVDKAQNLLGCGRTKVFALLDTGELQRAEKRLGRETMITVESIERTQQRQQPTKRPALKRRHPRGGANLSKSIRKLPITGDPDNSDDSTK